MKRDLANKEAQVYIIDAAKAASDIGLGKRTNNILQAAFFALTKIIPMEVAIEEMKKNNYDSYFKKAGQKIVDLNDQAVDIGVHAAVKVEIPESWKNAKDEEISEITATDFVREIVFPMDRQQGDKLPVSVFKNMAYLTALGGKTGRRHTQKRGVAKSVPKWNGEACIQCNRCAASCPHAAIRPVLLTEAERKTLQKPLQ